MQIEEVSYLLIRLSVRMNEIVGKMMRNFYTYVLLRQETINGKVYTEPCETAWASEAIFFIKIHGHREPGFLVTVKAQISVDGISWIDYPESSMSLSEDGDFCMRLSNFGGWLRLEMDSTSGSSYKTTVQLALKD